jgi:hypothetical protein
MQLNHRHIICFEQMSLEEATEWPELLEIVRRKVLPARTKIGGYSVANKRRERWWLFGTYAAALQRAISQLPRCLVTAQTSSHHALVFQPVNRIFDQSLVVFPLSSFSSLAGLQCRTHEIWARFFGSSMKDDLRYTPSDCFDTFPFPENWQNHPTLEAVGKTYYEFRADLMVRNEEGLTNTYNRFHDPDERHPEILKLRELHAEMDRAVLDAYGWTDIPTDCEFLLDYEIDEENWSPRKKKPWRYRWPDEVRDEVLARLLELNVERAAEEERLGLTNKKKTTKRRKKKPRKDTSATDLFS